MRDSRCEPRESRGETDALICSISPLRALSRAVRMRRVLRAYSDFAKRNQTISSCLAGGVLCSTGDLISQKIEGAKEIDLKRTVVYGGYGMLLVGPICSRVYRSWDRLLGETTRAKALKVTMDNFILTPALMPIFYTYKGLAYQDSWQKIRTDLDEKFGRTMISAWAFWIPASSSTFFLIPPHLRVTWMFVCELVWATMLSNIGFSTPELKTDLLHPADAMVSLYNLETQRDVPDLLPSPSP